MKKQHGNISKINIKWKTNKHKKLHGVQAHELSKYNKHVLFSGTNLSEIGLCFAN